MERVRILVVEDNPDLASAIRHGLNEHGYSVDVAHEGYRGEELAATEPYDLVILDLMLPDRDGVDLCKNLRRRGIETSVLMLTALSGTADKVSGLDAGADDYLTKPFEFEELLARVRALLRRGTACWRACGRAEAPEVEARKPSPLHQRSGAPSLRQRQRWYPLPSRTSSSISAAKGRVLTISTRPS
jgi:DNA-binding response OmpR family regulator